MMRHCIRHLPPLPVWLFFFFFFNTLGWKCDEKYVWWLSWPGNFVGTQSPSFSTRSGCDKSCDCKWSRSWPLHAVPPYGRQHFISLIDWHPSAGVCPVPAPVQFWNSWATKPVVVLLSLSPNDLGAFCSLGIRGEIGIVDPNEYISGCCFLPWRYSSQHLLVQTPKRRQTDLDVQYFRCEIFCVITLTSESSIEGHP